MISKEIEEKLEKLIHSLGCKLYDISFFKENGVDILRVSIMAENSKTTLDICQKVSEMISPLLDVYEPISNNYTLEVSSPGIERVLKTPRHFRLSVGERVQVKVSVEIEGTEEQENEVFEAIIKSVDSEGVNFKIIKDNELTDLNDFFKSNIIKNQDDQERFYPYSSLKKVKTIFKW